MIQEKIAYFCLKTLAVRCSVWPTWDKHVWGAHAISCPIPQIFFLFTPESGRGRSSGGRRPLASQDPRSKKQRADMAAGRPSGPHRLLLLLTWLQVMGMIRGSLDHDTSSSSSSLESEVKSSSSSLELDPKSSSLEQKSSGSSLEQKSSSSNSLEQESGSSSSLEQDIRDQIVADLGLGRLPDIARVSFDVLGEKNEKNIIIILFTISTPF